MVVNILNKIIRKLRYKFKKNNRLNHKLTQRLHHNIKNLKNIISNLWRYKHKLPITRNISKITGYHNNIHSKLSHSNNTINRMNKTDRIDKIDRIDRINRICHLYRAAIY